jgi:hypothetical protein
MMTLEVYGWRGWQIGLAEGFTTWIRTKVLFALADPAKWRKRWLAWYLWSEDWMDIWWKQLYEDQTDIDAGKSPKHKFDQRDFGSAITTPTPNVYRGNYVSRLTRGINKGAAEATLDMIDNKRAGTTTCNIRHLTDIDGNLINLNFDLVKTADRRAPDSTRPGRVMLFGVEPFSVQALTRGILGPSKMTHNMDPYKLYW